MHHQIPSVAAPIILRNSLNFWFFECEVRDPIVVVVVRGQRGCRCAHPFRRWHPSARRALSFVPCQRKASLVLPQTTGARARHVTEDGTDKDEGRTRWSTIAKKCHKKNCHNCKSRGDGFGFFCKPHEQNCNLYGCKASDNEKMKQKAVPSVFHPYFAAFTTRSDHNHALFEFQKGSEGTGLIETQSPLNHYLPPNMPIPGNITVPETQNADAGLSPPKVPVKASVLTTLRPTSLPNNIPTHLPSVIRPPPLRTYLPTYLPTFLPTYLPTYLHSFPPCYLLTFLPSNLPSHP